PLTIPMPALEGVFWEAKKQLDAASDEQLESFARMAVMTIEDLLDDDSGAGTESAAADAGGLRTDSAPHGGARGVGGQNGQREVGARGAADSALARDAVEPTGAGDRLEAAVPGDARTERPDGAPAVQKMAAGRTASRQHRVTLQRPRP